MSRSAWSRHRAASSSARSPSWLDQASASRWAWARVVAGPSRARVTAATSGSRTATSRPSSPCAAAVRPRASSSCWSSAATAARTTASGRGPARASTSSAARAVAPTSPVRASTTASRSGASAGQPAHRQPSPSGASRPAALAAAVTRRTERGWPAVAAQMSSVIDAGRSPGKASASRASVSVRSRGPTSIRSRYPSLTSDESAAGTGRSLRIASRACPSPLVTRAWTTATESGSSRWASSTTSSGRSGAGALAEGPAQGA